MRYPRVESKSVLVTGASSGIGLSAARVLRSRGWEVVPTARKPEDLERLRGEGFTPVELDMDDSASVRAAAGRALEIFSGRIGGLVNNAGFGQPGAVEDLSRETMRAQFETNVFGLQALSNSFIPVFRKQGWGRIVNISSVLGRISLPFMGLYSASKFALEALSDALRVELRGTGIAVALVEPGPIKTRFGERALQQAETGLDLGAAHHREAYREEIEKRKRMSRSSEMFELPPEAVAAKIAHALESPRPRRRYPVTFVARFGSFAGRFFPPGLLDYMMSRANKRRQGSDS